MLLGAADYAGVNVDVEQPSSLVTRHSIDVVVRHHQRHMLLSNEILKLIFQNIGIEILKLTN